MVAKCSWRQRFDAGDTIIEVLFSITIFSMIAVGGLATMNRGTTAVQTSLEMTQVRAQIDAQADMLRMLQQSYSQVYVPGKEDYAPDSYASVWKRITSTGPSGLAKTTNPSVMGDIRTETGCAVAPSKAFALNPAAIRVPLTTINNEPATYAQVRLPASSSDTSAAEGIWIEAVRGGMTGGVGGFTDFHIYSCWATAAGDPTTLGTIVRLYEPN